MFSPLPMCPQAKIKEELQADTVVVSDVYGDGRHVSINVISNAFEGEHAGQRGSLAMQLPEGHLSVHMLAPLLSANSRMPAGGIPACNPTPYS